ncbi:YecR family lipoprotein [Rhodanobacter sp. Soil772]|uniref:YecR family lipoprotein n=1 Tax=Rhodanobacter sp. Soil772 TaxID=1736406 RepID=UPI0009EAE9D3|nr:YecR family lipoprotein [Rhodanobacter sp. Soil772]
MKSLFLIAVVAVAVSGCATTKSWSATGGSRADATVRLSYTYGPFEQPRASEQQALNLAATRCAAWGYKGAEAFGGAEQKCTAPGGMGGCNQFEVTKEFQCTGTGSGNPNAGQN